MSLSWANCFPFRTVPREHDSKHIYITATCILFIDIVQCKHQPPALLATRLLFPLPHSHSHSHTHDFFYYTKRIALKQMKSVPLTPMWRRIVSTAIYTLTRHMNLNSSIVDLSKWNIGFLCLNVSPFQLHSTSYEIVKVLACTNNEFYRAKIVHSFLIHGLFSNSVAKFFGNRNNDAEH